LCMDFCCLDVRSVCFRSVVLIKVVLCFCGLLSLRRDSVFMDCCCHYVGTVCLWTVVLT
jgi:hypothetical protein